MKNVTVTLGVMFGLVGFIGTLVMIFRAIPGAPAAYNGQGNLGVLAAYGFLIIWFAGALLIRASEKE